MSLGAFGDEGYPGVDDENPHFGEGFDAGLIAGWERAFERAALLVEGMIGTDDDTQVSARALAMTLRAMKPRASEGAATSRECES